MLDDSNVELILFRYFSDIYCPEYKSRQNDSFLKSTINRFKKGMIKGAKGCWIAYLILDEQGSEDFKVAGEVRRICHKYSLINPLSNIQQCNLLETISDFLDYDMVNNKVFANRFLLKRVNELFEYICKKANVKPEAFTDDEKYTSICAAAYGVTAAQLIDYSKYSTLLDKGMYQPADIGIGNELSIQYIGPLNKIGHNCATVIASKLMNAEYGQIHYFKNIAAAIIGKGNNISFVHNAIWEYLLDKLTDAYYSTDKSKFTKEQIVRQLTYNETDCKIVIEKIAAAIEFYVLANNMSKTIEKSIVYGDYRNIKSSVQREVSANQSKNSSTQRTNKTIIDTNAKLLQTATTELEAEKKKNELLESENAKLREQLLAVRQQIDRAEDKNNTIDELRKEKEILCDENESLYRRIHNIRVKYDCLVNSQDNDRTTIQSESPSFDDTFFKDKKLIIVGGRTEINRKLLECMPKAKVVYDATDSIFDVRNYDLVVFFTDYLSHTIYHKYINQCRLYNAPVLYLNGSSIGNIKKNIFAYLSDENQC